MLFGLSSHIGAGLIFSSAPKIPRYYAHFRSKNFVDKKNSHIQGKSAVYPFGSTSILTQNAGIFLRQNRVRMCALWLSNKQLKPRRVINRRLIRKLTILQSVSLAAPFTQGRRHGTAVTEGLSFFFPSHSIKQQTVEPCAKNFSVI